MNNNEKFKFEILKNIVEDGNSDNLSEALRDYVIPKQSIDLKSFEGFLKSFNSLYKETNLNHSKLLSLAEENSVLKNRGIPQNQVLSKIEANKLLTEVKKISIDSLEDEIKKYDPEILMFLFYGIADQLALLSSIALHKLETGTNSNFSVVKNDPYSILTALISNMDSNYIIEISNETGREKNLIDIIFNLVYKTYVNQQKEEKSSYPSKIDIRRIYQLAYMVMKSNILLKSNELLYEQGESLIIKDWTFIQSGNFEEKILRTRVDIAEFNYKEDTVCKVFEEYSKREGFCADDLLAFAKISAQSREARIHLKTFDRENLKNSILKVTNVRDYGIDRFLDVLILKKDVEHITDSTNKISVRPFVELNNGTVLYSESLLMQASILLQIRMLQQSFTSNKKLQKFISKNYDEAGIADLIMGLEKVDLPYLEHVNLDKIKAQHIKSLINIKGITKEFDLIFIKNNILYVIEYKTWKISSHNIIQVLNEQKKISKNIASHIKAIEILKAYPKEFKKLFGEGFNQYYKIELIMVFQNPTAFKYLNKSKEVKVFSPREFNDFIIN